MALALQAEERRVVEAALRFANLRRITSARQVERLFAEIVDFHESMPTWQDAATGRERAMVDATALYIEAQRQVQDWLARIARSEGGRQEVAREITARLADGIGARLSIRNRRLSYAFDIGSVPTACVLAVALILDEGRRLTSRLRRCGWSRCQRFNLDLDPTGRPRRYCTPEHKRQHDAETVPERVRRYRARLVRR
jgi:hypothetical protein